MKKQMLAEGFGAEKPLAVDKRRRLGKPALRRRHPHLPAPESFGKFPGEAMNNVTFRHESRLAQSIPASADANTQPDRPQTPATHRAHQARQDRQAQPTGAAANPQSNAESTDRPAHPDSGHSARGQPARAPRTSPTKTQQSASTSSQTPPCPPAETTRAPDPATEPPPAPPHEETSRAKKSP